jgi:hypothetical protein
VKRERETFSPRDEDDEAPDHTDRERAVSFRVKDEARQKRYAEYLARQRAR